MRLSSTLALCALAAVVGCTPFPAVEDRLGDPGAYPRLQRIDALTATLPARPRLTGGEVETLKTKGAALRTQSTGAATDGPDADTLERLRRAREARDEAGGADGGQDLREGRTRVSVGDAGVVMETGGGDADTLARVGRLRDGGKDGDGGAGAETILERAEAAAATDGEGLDAEERRLLLLRASTAGSDPTGDDGGDSDAAATE